MHWWNSVEAVSRINTGLQITGAIFGALIVVFGIRVSTLQDQREWRPLSERQIAEWVSALTPCKVQLFQVVYGDSNAEKFSRSLNKVGSRLGCRVTVERTYTEIDPGIWIKTEGEQPAARVISILLQSLRYTVHFQHLENGTTPGRIMIWVGDKQ